MEKNEFYMVLNNNHSISADNVDNSGHFTIAWDNPITFNPEDNWQVALTEIDYMYDSHTISTHHNITYWYEGDYVADVTVRADISLKKNHPHFYNIVTSNHKFNVEIEDETAIMRMLHVKLGHWHPYIQFESPTKFGVHDLVEWFPNGDHEHKGVAHLSDDGKTWILPTKRKITEFLDSKTRGRILSHFWFMGKHTVSKTYWFKSDLRFESGAALAKHLRENCSAIFQTVKFDKKFQLVMMDRVLRVQFNNGLHFVLGYYHTILSKSSNADVFIGDTEPKFKRGAGMFYIYASCCGPTFIETDYKPLLRRLHVANEHYSFGMLYNMMLKNPMYVSVCTTSLNQIEIKICNSAGHVISFPVGGCIILTLHFKNKYSSINT